MNKKIFEKIFIGLGALVIWGVLTGMVQAQIKDGTLIRATGYNEVYVLENGLRRWIVSSDVFNGLGYKWSNVSIVSRDVVNAYPLGDDLTGIYSYPDGSLIRGEGPEVYLIEIGKKRWIPNPQIFQTKGFRWENIIKTSQSFLDSINRGDDIALDEKNKEPSTFISTGPCQQFQSEIPTIQTTEVEFKFSGSDPSGLDRDLSFETFLQGYDQRWQAAYSNQRKVYLGEGAKTYTFYVRAKNRAGYFDESPAFCQFSTKISSYKDRIKLYSVYGWGTNPEYESIAIGASYSLIEPVNITGWTIKTNRRIFTIPQGVKIINPESVYNIKKDIYLNYSERLTIYGGKSPIGEDSFQLNKCWWQISDQQKYRDCFYEHNQESDFLTGEWRVYLNQSSDMLDDKEQATLKDINNQIVDTFSY